MVRVYERSESNRVFSIHMWATVNDGTIRRPSGANSTCPFWCIPNYQLLLNCIAYKHPLFRYYVAVNDVGKMSWMQNLDAKWKESKNLTIHLTLFYSPLSLFLSTRWSWTKCSSSWAQESWLLPCIGRSCTAFGRRK